MRLSYMLRTAFACSGHRPRVARAPHFSRLHFWRCSDSCADLGIFLAPILTKCFTDNDTGIMTDAKRTALRHTLEAKWRTARAHYVAAGEPFGPGRGLDVWIEYGQCTTTN